MTSPAEVIALAADVAEAAGTAASWIEAHGERMGLDRATLMREFRRYGRRGARLREAAQRPMGVAVFGASQAGKSYLISRLAAMPGGQLTTKFGNTTLDFLKDINPPGGQEATGLVTRFTTRPPPTPPDAPLALRLLSQTDVIKVLANTFLEDFDVDIVPPNAVELERLFASLTAVAQPAPVDTLSGDDVEDLAEYFERYFRNNGLLQQLNMVGYWPRAADLAPRLRITDRATLFAPLWGGTEKFTALYATLGQGLAALGFASVVHCGLDALVPRESSLIDARRLFDIGQPATEETLLTLVTPSGGRARLARTVVAALIAEVTVPLAERPWPFFDATDLLDFPGARTREVIVDAEKFLAQPEKLGHALLRGKVAYLFQRYNAEQEITAMLLCVGPSNQEVQTLPRMVKEWIDQTLGPTPASRAEQRNSLFFVLTKFDAEFEDKAGEDPSSGTRWTARLQASLVDFFKAYDWPSEWTPGRPFDHLFWLRNPSIGFGAVFDYGPKPAAGGPAPEIGVAPRAAAAVATKRAAYLANDLVKKHIADASLAWDAALAPNDGGIGRLAGQLAPVCDPTLKATQVEARVTDLARVMTERLRPYWRSNDQEVQLADARTRAGTVLRTLVECARAQMFGSLLRALQISAEQVAGVHWRMQTEPEEAGAPVGTVASVDEYADELAGLLGETSPAPAEVSTGRLDYFERFVGAVIAAWDETLNLFASDIAGLAAYKLPPEQAALLVGQIAAGARRTDLRGRIAATLRTHASFHGHASAGTGKIVLIAEDMVNTFVAKLGFDATEEARRPTVGSGGAMRYVFASRPAVRGLPSLGEQPAAYDRIFHVDWMAAFARLMEDNVSDQSAEAFDREANDALGAWIRRLAGSGA